MRFTAILAVLVLATGTRALAESAQCAPPKNIVFITKGVNDTPNNVMDAVQKNPNTMVLLAPDVDIIFSNQTVMGEDGKIGTYESGAPFIRFNTCVTLASFEPPTTNLPPETTSDAIPPVVPGSGRTPHSVGPRLQYTLDKGPNGEDRSEKAAFIEMRCTQDVDEWAAFPLSINGKIISCVALNPSPLWTRKTNDPISRSKG
jgi:hypothetical protein